MVPFNALSSTSGIKQVNPVYSWMGFAAVQNITACLWARDLFYAHVNEALTAVSVTGDFSLKHSGTFLRELSVCALLKQIISFVLHSIVLYKIWQARNEEQVSM